MTNYKIIILIWPINFPEKLYEYYIQKWVCCCLTKRVQYLKLFPSQICFSSQQNILNYHWQIKLFVTFSQFWWDPCFSDRLHIKAICNYSNYKKCSIYFVLMWLSSIPLKEAVNCWSSSDIFFDIAKKLKKG